MKSKLAINGGTPVRQRGWPHPFPGGSLYGQEEINAAIKVLEARSPYRYYGEDMLYEVDNFEKEMAEYVGTKYAIAVASGSTALTVALLALGVGPGTEVILPSLMWISDVNAVVHARAIPVICDVDENWGMDLESLKKAITPRTKAIIAIHMAGSACDIEGIRDIAKAHNIALVEDCSQASGAFIKGKHVGSFGDIGTFSLQLNKNFTTGEGGAIVTNSEELFRRCKPIHDVGFERGDDGVSVAKNSPYENFGIGGRMDEIRGAIARVQLRKLSFICSSMRGHQQNIKNALIDIPKIKWREIIDPNGDTGYCLAWMHEDGTTAKLFREAMNAEGIPVTVPPGGVHQSRNMVNLLAKKAITTKGCPWECPFNKDSQVDYSIDMNKKSNEIFDKSLMLVLPPLLTEDDEKDVIEAFKKVAAELL